jgi:hypothetical protein
MCVIDELMLGIFAQFNLKFRLAGGIDKRSGILAGRICMHLALGRYLKSIPSTSPPGMTVWILLPRMLRLAKKNASLCWR